MLHACLNFGFYQSIANKNIFNVFYRKIHTIETCQSWQLTKLRIAIKVVKLKIDKMKIDKIENYQNWKLPQLKFATIENCQNWNLKTAKLKISNLLNCQHWLISWSWSEVPLNFCFISQFFMVINLYYYLYKWHSILISYLVVKITKLVITHVAIFSRISESLHANVSAIRSSVLHFLTYNLFVASKNETTNSRI